MKSQRALLTPQMLQYAEKFDDRGEIRWLPYLMYFHAADHRSDVVNTDSLGFRISHGQGVTGSVGGPRPDGPVRLLAGSSTVFGIGASSDADTLASRLWSEHAPSMPWLNFGGRSHNSTQELLLFVLYRHLLPQIDEIVLFSGFNNLGLSRLPAAQRGDHGAFFNCGEYFEQMDQLKAAGRKASGGGLARLTGRRTPPAEPEPVEEPPILAEQIDRGAELTLRHLESWKLLAHGIGAKLTFVLQPLAGWVRERPAPEEQLLFEELDSISNFSQVYGDIALMSSGRSYAAALREGCERLDVPFFDLGPALNEAVSPDEWLFVDRIHFTDSGHDIVARLLAENLKLS